MMGGTPCQIDIKLAKIEGRKNATIKERSGGSYKLPVYCVSKLIPNRVTGRRGRAWSNHDQPDQEQAPRPLGHPRRASGRDRKPL